MIINDKILDDLTERAKKSPRLREAYDLRNSQDDNSQRMLNAIEPGTQIPVHRHWYSSETVLCIRGHYEELLYDAEGTITEIIDMRPGGAIVNVPIGQWHSLRSLESGTILFEAKDGKYKAVEQTDILQ